MIKALLSFYNIKLPLYFVYMLQQVEYNPTKFMGWLKRLIGQKTSIKTVTTRKTLEYTPIARLLAIISYTFITLTLLIAVFIALNSASIILFTSIFLWFIAVPYLLVIFLIPITLIGDIIYISPKQRRTIEQGKSIFSNHNAIKIAVIGSYGKTTMKEILNTILSEKYKVSATPGNMNTLYSQAKFALNLSGEEDVLVVEFGEGSPGDIKKMADVLKPDYAIITGLSPNHLDEYKTIEAIAKDMIAIYDFTDSNKVYVSKESSMLEPYLIDKVETYSTKEVMGWKVSNILVSVKNTMFLMKKGKKELNIMSSLLGRHQVAPLALAVAVADALGLTKNEIEQGCNKIKPYDHRMQPRSVHGAWLIDDTYNGNLEGLKVGLKLLGELDMKRKWFVTPGLVDQGDETTRVHVELGEAIASINPDIVVLMDNSARPIIEDSMKLNGFTGDLRIEKKPLDFYTNIEYVVADGDLVLMQNDWTDNYN